MPRLHHGRCDSSRGQHLREHVYADASGPRTVLPFESRASTIAKILVLSSLLPMELHIDTEKLISRLEDMLRQREEQLLSEFVARITEEPGMTSDSPATDDASGHHEIKGIQLHALYSVSFVADRWDVSADNVRKKSEEELPRSDWKGGEIRYRGIDILLYEGVDVEEHVGEASSPPVSGEIDRAPEQHQSVDRVSTPAEKSGEGRPYNGNLPALSDQDSSRD